MQALHRKLDVVLVQILPYNCSENYYSFCEDSPPAGLCPLPGCGFHPQTSSAPTFLAPPPLGRDSAHCRQQGSFNRIWQMGSPICLLLLQELRNQHPLVSIACLVMSFHLLRSWSKLFSSCSPSLTPADNVVHPLSTWPASFIRSVYNSDHMYPI